MTRLWTPAAILIGLCALAQAGPIDPNLLLDSNQPVSFYWNRTDAGGFNWDIQPDGSISDGTSDAYDTAMRLQVNGASCASGTAVAAPDGHEIQIGPYTGIRGLEVYRRIAVPAGKQYCRYVDLFHNTTDEAMTFQIEYYINMGSFCRSTAERTGDDHDGVIGSVASDADQSSRPALGFIYGAQGSAVTPTFHYTNNNDQLYIRAELTVKPDTTAGLCVFAFQQRPMAAAERMLNEFDLSEELALLPGPIVSTLANVRLGMLRLADGAIFRSRDGDTLIAADGRETLGRIANERFALTTRFGPIEIAAEDVLGLAVRPGRDRVVTLATADGQVIQGQLDTPLLFAAEGADAPAEVSLSALRTLGFRINKDRPQEPQPDQPLLVLRDGQRLAWTNPQPWTLMTPLGQVTLDADAVAELVLVETDSGMPEVALHNGTRLAGLLSETSVPAELSMGPRVDLPIHSLLGVQYPTHDIDEPLASMRMRDGTLLRGRIATESIVIRTNGQTRSISWDDLAEIAFPEEGVNPVTATLSDGSTVTGQLETTDLTIELAGPQAALTVYAGLIERVVLDPKRAEALSADDEQESAEPLTEVQRLQREIEQLQRALATARLTPDRATALNEQLADRMNRLAEAQNREAADRQRQRIIETRVIEGPMIAPPPGMARPGGVIPPPTPRLRR